MSSFVVSIFFGGVCSISCLPPGRTLTFRSVFVSSQKHRVEEPALAPHKALKVSTSSTAHRAAEALAAMHHGSASGGVGPEEPTAEGKGAEVATERAG